MRSKKCSIKVGDIVCPTYFLPGYPVGISPETRCVVRKVHTSAGRAEIVREDGRDPAIYALTFSALRRFGEVTPCEGP